MKDRKENKDNEKLADRDPEVKDKSGVDEGRKARSGNRPGGTAKISQVKKMSSLPLIPLRGVIIFPGVALSLDIGRSASVAALREAMKSGQELIIAMQKDMSKDEPKPDDIYRIAVRGRVRQLLELPDNMFKILVEGMERVRIVRYNKLDPYFKVATVQYTDLPDAAENDNWKQAAARSLIKRFRSYAEHSGKIAPEPQAVLEGSSDPDLIVNHLCHLLPLSGPEQQNLLESTSLSQRVELMLNYIQRESELSKIERQLDEKVKTKINRSQREYFLREQIRTIQSELGGDDETEMLDDRNEMLKKLEQSKMQDDYKEKIRKEIDRFSRIPPSFPEATVQRNWIELLLELPFGRVDEEHLDLKAARKILDRDHYGMKKLKERIMEYLAVRKLQLDRQDQAGIRSPILCFVGPPGTGKTSIAKAIAETLGRRYVSMSLGGIKDEAEIRGHRRTYIGAMPGRVIQGIRQAGTDNPLFLLDEIDKLGTDFRGDPSSALLEVLDPEQNDKFRDHYVEFPYDLSQVLFITTANNGDRIPDPLYDRMEVIEVSGYTEEEKIEIARRHLLPRQLEQHGLSKKQVHMTRGAIAKTISWYTREAGVRQLERELAHLCRRAAIEIAETNADSIRITPQKLEEMIGTRRYTYDVIDRRDRVGMVTGLAWTYSGGDTLMIEVNVLPGEGNLQLTGQLGDIMKESAAAALTYVRSRSDELGLEPELIRKSDIHIHIPAGAIPKDGPSAGITIATALASALTKRAVKYDLAMTGEITLRGRVLSIGGLKEKAVAAKRAGIKTILIPTENKRDLEEVPDTVLKKMNIILVDHMDQVLEQALLPADESKE